MLPVAADNRPSDLLWFYSRCCHRDTRRCRHMGQPSHPDQHLVWELRKPSWPREERVVHHHRSEQPGYIFYLLDSSGWSLHNKQPEDEMMRQTDNHNSLMAFFHGLGSALLGSNPIQFQLSSLDLLGRGSKCWNIQESSLMSDVVSSLLAIDWPESNNLESITFIRVTDHCLVPDRIQSKVDQNQRHWYYLWSPTNERTGS